MRGLHPLLRYAPILLLLASAARAEKLVTARSTVSREYLQKRVVDGKRQPQTYVFMPGRFFAGITHDSSLDKTSFRTIAERLASDLQRQDFYPAKSITGANLLLVVHWGVTYGRNRDSTALFVGAENLTGFAQAGEEAQRNLDDAAARGDAMGVAEARGTLDNLGNETRSTFQDMLQSQRASPEDSATLLGFSAALRKQSDTLAEYERQQTLMGLALEECYFVIVMAYDAPTLFTEKKLKRVWTLRTSISSAGVNFPEALDRISNIASRYFATPQATVSFDYPPERKRTERVELGDLIVLGTVKP